MQFLFTLNKNNCYNLYKLVFLRGKNKSQIGTKVKKWKSQIGIDLINITHCNTKNFTISYCENQGISVKRKSNK